MQLKIISLQLKTISLCNSNNAIKTLTITSATQNLFMQLKRNKLNFCNQTSFYATQSITSAIQFYATKKTKTIFKKQKLLLNSNFTVYYKLH